MKKSLSLLFISLMMIVLMSCKNTTSSGSDSSSPASSSDQGLTNAKVESAVASMLSEWRLGGSVSVRGIQEIPQQNSAIADLQFNDFQYGTTYEGGLLKTKDFKPRPKSNDPIPHPDEMFPQRKVSYSKEGKAILTRYNDSRWVLKEVRWGRDSGVKGTVDLR